ncbi:hypothetical protein ABZ203_20335 [Streptomyces albidoflavus]|uniref:hypothetical protein n=1 Tax=Streptomyces TaxID=1883 RepID=UPI001A644E23|nr:hypothetical protein [Streptomyces sp. BV333]MBL0802720.1 hypothetical protein [Streptomyces albidoflavus]MBV1955154.1 hypothetical protein [Streptomyces sp. BV333]
MGSLRNPIGPLPSSIYWRRRVVLLSVVAVLALLVTWLVVSVGGGGKRDGASGSGGHSPAPSITPGDSPSGPAISEHPGGRDESGEDDESGTGGSGGEGEGAGGGEAGDGNSGSGSGAGGAGAGGGETTGEQVPTGSTLPNCPAGAVEMSLRPTKNTYEPDQKPKLVLKAENTSKADCKVDLGPKTAVLTITETGEDKPLWSSAHCPATGSLLLKLPAQGSVTHTVTWDRRASADKCATPPAGAAGPGTYLAEVEAPVATAKISFVLAKD